MKHKEAKAAKVLLLGSYGRGNIGDDAFLIAATHLLRRYSIIINAAQDAPLPEGVRQNVMVLNTENSTDWRQKISVLLQAKAIIYGGGDLWVELLGDKRPRQSLWKMFLLNLAARLLGKKVLYIGCGAGQLSGFSLILARLSALLANGVILRDEISQQTLGLKYAIVLPDLTITLFSQPPKRSILRPERRIKLAISLLYYIPKPEQNFNLYITGLADRLSELDAARFEITLLPLLTAAKTSYNDIWASEQLLQRLRSNHSITISRPENFEQFMYLLAKADVVIGSRLHANILATWLGKPCIGLAYRPKVRRFFERNKLDDNCLDLNKRDKLPALISKLVADYENEARKAYRIWEESNTEGRAYERFVQTYL